MNHLPELNWQQLRGKAPSGSRQDGFEELANQLMIYGGLVEWPAGTRFSTFGNPDGGREGRGELPDGGGVWAWQAKYLFGFDTAEITQITKSVNRVLDTEPDLRRYYILLPYNLPAGDTTTVNGTTTSAWTKWNNAVTAWETAAAAKGLSVEFVYLGETQLNNCLLHPSQAGRMRYWFDRETFTDDRFQEIAAKAVADAGGRYDPRLTVDVPAAAVFNGLARTPAFEVDIRTALAGLRRTSHLTVPEDSPDPLRLAVTELRKHLGTLEADLADAIVQACRPEGRLPDLKPATDLSETALEQVTDLLYEHHRGPDGHFSGPAASLAAQTTNLQTALSDVVALRTGRAWRGFGRHAVLLHGTGGAGKTHLLCDLAQTRTEQGQPTIIVLAEQFEHGPIEADIGRLIGFTGPAGQLLAALDAACQTAGTIGLLIIDGLNETTDRKLWARYLNRFLADVAGYPHLRLVLSCRSEFLDDTLTPKLLDRLHRVRHTGFAEVKPHAIEAFLDFYGIERPSFPMLDPEFTNPLFLKLLCRTLQTRHEHQFPRTGIGTSWIYTGFLDAVNTRLADASRCDYSDRCPLVRTAVEQIAALMHTRGRRLPFDEVEKITTALLPGTGFSTGLLNGLLKEAILSDLPAADGATDIRFGYERLGDIALARLVASADRPVLDAQVIAMAEHWHRNAGVMQALASVLPETHNVELLDILSIPADQDRWEAHRDFLLSLAWRRPDAVTARTEQLVLDLRTDPDLAGDVTNAMLQVATIAGHRLNAEWLHQQLTAASLPERDATWSHLCDWQDETSGHLPALINWAWSPASSTATDQTRHLTALTLAWALTTTDRPTRDNATKALIAVLEPAPHLYPPLLHRFTGCDDDSVEERLLAVGCGLAQRTLDPQTAITIATAVRDHTIGRGYWPQNYLSRDYIRRAIDAGLAHGWQPPDDLATRIQPPYTTTWIEPVHTTAQIEELAGAPDYRYSPVSRPALSDFDDFHRDVVQPLTEVFDLGDAGDTQYLGRILFDQVLQLGWTPERFGDMDRNLRRGRSGEGRRHEGFAQKYTWIAVKQLIGRMTDRFPLRPSHHDHGRSDYQTPLDVHGHDIDPTLLLRRTENLVYADTPTAWFAPATMTFPDGIDDDWVKHDQHSPPADRLITCTDDRGRRWYTLEGHYRWSQPRHPDEAAADAPYHGGWMQIRSYLIDTADAQDWRAWAERQDWHGRWMPESGSPTGLLLGDHPYRWGWPDLQPDDRTGHRRDPPPATPIVTTSRYGGVANDWDQSDSKHLYTYVPSTALAEILRFRRLGDFQWGRDAQKQAAGFAARTHGPDSVHVCEQALHDGLSAHAKAVLWTVTAVKETIRSDYHRIRTGEPFERRYKASYLDDGSGIQLLSARARTMAKGGRTSAEVTWRLTPP